jgi:hypothetical protein
MATRTKTDDRTSDDFASSFAQEAPEAQLPAAVQQVIMDERPQGAMKVAKERDLQKVLRDIKQIASAAGDDFFYRWPVKSKDPNTGQYVTDWVEGPSVKCANAVARIYGNCAVKVRAFDQGPHWILYAQFYDMETGFVYERPFQQRKNQNIGGKMDKDRALDMVFQIGCSKAARNAVCNALSEFTDYAFDVAREQLVEKIGKNLEGSKNRVLDKLAELGKNMDPRQLLKRIEAIRGKPLASWVASDVARTVAEIQSVNDGMAHMDELWPPSEAGAPRPTEDSVTSSTTPATDKPAETAKVETAADDRPKQEGQPASTAAPVVDDADARAATAEAEREDSFKRCEQAIELNKKELDNHNLGDGAASVKFEEFSSTVRETIKNWHLLDDEDKAVLLGRWNSAELEWKRAQGRKTGKRRG